MRVRHLGIISLLCLIFCLGLVFITSPVAANDDPEYITEGNWGGSGLVGHQPDCQTYWTDHVGGFAKWTPNFSGPVKAKVYFHLVRYKHSNDPAAKLEVKAGRKIATKMIDYENSERGWIYVGTFDFRGTPSEYVKLTKINKPGKMRASAIRFDILGENGVVISNFAIDELTGGNLFDGENWRPSPIQIHDVNDENLKRIVSSLVVRNIAGLRSGKFAPDKQITTRDFLIWASNAIECSKQTLDKSGKYSDLSNQMNPRLRAEHTNINDALSQDVLERILKNAAAIADKETADQTLMSQQTEYVDYAKITRAEAARRLWQFIQSTLETGPPTEKQWELVFHEPFDGNTVDTEVWNIESASPGHILSSRWPENVEVSNGLLTLHTRKENRGNKIWTTGNIWTKEYRGSYGYYEARMKIGSATGLNNAFWIMTEGKPEDPYHFEIDITEARYPNKNAVTLHNWKGTHSATGLTLKTAEMLDDEFHVYGLEWTSDEVVWYFDGHKVRTVKHDYCRMPAPIRLSSAVGGFAGKIVDELDGTKMIVDWVKVYKSKK